MQKSLKATIENCVSGTADCTPVTMPTASAFAWLIDGFMLPVVSMAISMSAFGGTAGTPTVFVSVAVPSVASPARSVNVALPGDTLAVPVPTAVRAITAPSERTARIPAALCRRWRFLASMVCSFALPMRGQR